MVSIIIEKLFPLWEGIESLIVVAGVGRGGKLWCGGSHPNVSFVIIEIFSYNLPCEQRTIGETR